MVLFVHLAEVTYGVNERFWGYAVHVVTDRYPGN